MKFFGLECKGCVVHCLPDIVHKPLPNMFGTFLKKIYLVGRVVALVLKLLNLKCEDLTPYQSRDITIKYARKVPHTCMASLLTLYGEMKFCT